MAGRALRLHEPHGPAAPDCRLRVPAGRALASPLPAAMRHVVTLGGLVGRIERLEIRCTRCPRHGRLLLVKLIAEHGLDLPMPELAVRLAANCAKAQATSSAERCFVVFPQLLNLSASPN